MKHNFLQNIYLLKNIIQFTERNICLQIYLHNMRILYFFHPANISSFIYIYYKTLYIFKKIFYMLNFTEQYSMFYISIISIILYFYFL